MVGWAIDEIEVRLPTIPWKALPALQPGVREDVERQALELEARYVDEALTHPAFCPRPEQRSALATRRLVVHYAVDRDIGALLDQMWMSLELPHVVTHVVFPLLEVDPRRWTAFCESLTDAGHALRGMAPALAVTSMHPRLPVDGAESLDAIFLRSPDPMLRWVRLEEVARTPCCAAPGEASVERVAARLRAIRQEGRASYSELVDG